jgi:hypothetical protein
MTIVFWLVVAALVITLLPAALFAVLYVFTREPVAKQRAQLCWRWAVLSSLLGIIFFVYDQLAETILELF